MEVAGAPEVYVTTYKNSWRHISEETDFHSHRLENLKSLMTYISCWNLNHAISVVDLAKLNELQ
jgi:hypothetical protein